VTFHSLATVVVTRLRTWAKCRCLTNGIASQTAFGALDLPAEEGENSGGRGIFPGRMHRQECIVLKRRRFWVPLRCRMFPRSQRPTMVRQIPFTIALGRVWPSSRTPSRPPLKTGKPPGYVSSAQSVRSQSNTAKSGPIDRFRSWRSPGPTEHLAPHKTKLPVEKLD